MNEPEEEWLNIMLKDGADLTSRGPYHLNQQDKQALDTIFDRLHREGTRKLSYAEAGTHVGWPAFVVWRNNKPRVVIDIRGLNAASQKDASPCKGPRISSPASQVIPSCPSLTLPPPSCNDALYQQIGGRRPSCRTEDWKYLASC